MIEAFVIALAAAQAAAAPAAASPTPPANYWTCTVSNDAGETHRLDMAIIDGAYGDPDQDGEYEIFPVRLRFGAPTLGITNRDSETIVAVRPGTSERVIFSDARENPIFFVGYPRFDLPAIDVTVTVMARERLEQSVREHLSRQEMSPANFQFRGGGRCVPLPESESR